MILRRVSKRVHSKFLLMCNKTTLNSVEGSEYNKTSSEEKIVEKKPKRISQTTINKIDKYLKGTPYQNSKIINEIPTKYFTLKKQDCVTILYLIDEGIASKIVWQMNKIKGDLRNKFICDTNSGFGFIAKRLLSKGAKVRIYESCPEFRTNLQDLCRENLENSELFTKDFFYMNIMSYIDKVDRGNRVQQLIKGIPSKPWNGDPAITVVGTMPKIDFVLYLIRMVVQNSELTSVGRVEIFALMRNKHFNKLSSNPSMDCKHYTAFSVSFQLFFDYKLLEKYDRKAFIPYESKRKSTSSQESNEDPICLVHLCLKKKLPAKQELLLALYYFVIQGFGRGRKRIIPTMEKWLPDCGIKLITSKSLKKSGVSLTIYTEFRELTPKEILILFMEMADDSNYSHSPFIALMEADLIKKETIESDIFENGDEVEEKIVLKDTSYL